MFVYCILCSFLVFILSLTKTNESPVLKAEATASTKLRFQPQTHILSLVKQNKTHTKNFELNSGYKMFEDGAKYAHISNRQQPTKGKLIRTDDLFESNKNTLENTNDEFSRLRNETDSGIYLRFKQSIPVLEPVRHLLNTVREGGFNHTTHFNKTRHQLIDPGEVGDVDLSSPSSAIETEAEREMVLHGSESTNFQLLDFLGSIGGMIWGFLMNIKKLFAASSGNASAALSGGSF